MASTTYRLRADYEQAPLERRLSGGALALAFNLLLLLVLLGIGAFRPTPRPQSTALVVDMLPESHAKAATAAAAAARPKPQKHTTPLPPPPVVLPAKPLIPQTHSDELIAVSPADMAAGDLRNLPKADRSAGDSEEVGLGPHGEALYAAEWAREPTDAEMNAYLPHNPRSGYGMVACKTAPNNRVEDCVELGNDPPGTHLASTLRQAAWQFHVRPPRKGGKALIGAWVRIRFDFTVSGEPGD